MQFALANSELLGKHNDASSFGRFIGKRGKLGDVGKLDHLDPGDGQELDRLPISQCDRPGFIQQEHVHVSRCFHGTPAHGEHVLLDQPVNSRNAYGAQQSPDGGRDEADQQGDKNQNGKRGIRIGAERLESNDHDKENDRQAAKKDRQCDFVGGLLAACPLDQGDHVVQEALTGIGGDADCDLIGKDAGASGHRAAVSTRFTNDRGRLTGNRGFVHTGSALDHIAIAGNDLACLDDNDIIPS